MTKAADACPVLNLVQLDKVNHHTGTNSRTIALRTKEDSAQREAIGGFLRRSNGQIYARGHVHLTKIWFPLLIDIIT